MLNMITISSASLLTSLWILSSQGLKLLQQFLGPFFVCGMFHRSIGWLTIFWDLILHSEAVRRYRIQTDVKEDVMAAGSMQMNLIKTLLEFISYGTHSFKSNFESWPSGSTPFAPEEGRRKLKLKQQDVGLGLKGLAKSSIGTEQIPPLLEENGKIEVWRINCSAKTPVPKEDIGKFYGGDCYIVLYTYMCYWIGKDSIKVDQNMTARLATTMFNSLKESAVRWCIYYICVLLQQCSTHEKEELFKWHIYYIIKTYEGYLEEKYGNDASKHLEFDPDLWSRAVGGKNEGKIYGLSNVGDPLGLITGTPSTLCSSTTYVHEIQKLNGITEELVKDKEEDKERLNGVIEDLVKEKERDNVEKHAILDRMTKFKELLKLVSQNIQPTS
ncbi:hypothetical protein L1987_02071 [Smallanthus sonchifolius]|uniref:Uncharacterized protein n=1 Tax=Smallanthus sonchifolius TaxID=185202 RepID=A0ACB9K6U7_9ASTR|nr:hypothetical protein L1987_02071 [Smallanthus sonchifolius]